MKKSLIKICALLSLLLILCTHIVFSSNEPHTYDHALYTVEDINTFFDGIDTSRYIQVFVSSADDLKIYPIVKDEYIDIYQWQRGLLQSDFEKSANAIALRLANEVSAEEFLSKSEGFFYPSQEDIELYGLGTYHIDSFQTSFCTFITIISDFDSEDETMYLDGIPVEIDQTKTDAQILSSIDDIKEQVFSIFDREFADTKIIRKYNGYMKYGGVESLSIYFYNEKDHILNTMRDVPVSDYIRITFDNDPISETILKNVSISYYQNRIDVEESYIVSKKMKLLSLEEAEELLYKGYTFGNHSCPLCMSKKDKADYFEGYDFVGMKYLFETDYTSSMSEQMQLEGIPFYVFYKNMKTSKNGKQLYAETYVPAVEISGYEEYFTSQRKNHKYN